MNIKDWGGGDLEDVAAAARYLQRLPDVDPGRIGIFGGSYGGYMTYMGHEEARPLEGRGGLGRHH